MKLRHKMMMVFECADMPEEVFITWDKIFETYDYGIYLDWEVGSLAYQDETDEQALMIDQWLIKNGAIPETVVLISRDKG